MIKTYVDDGDGMRETANGEWVRYLDHLIIVATLQDALDWSLAHPEAQVLKFDPATPLVINIGNDTPPAHIAGVLAKSRARIAK